MNDRANEDGTATPPIDPRNGETSEIPFNVAYLDAAEYERMLPPHYYSGEEDVDVVARLLDEILGPRLPGPGLRVLELGCGTGRVTRVLAPYARELHSTDKSAGMIRRFRDRFPAAWSRCADTETALSDLRQAGERFDVVCSFWSMSYPLLECFETTSTSGVLPNPDGASGTARAARLVTNLLDVLALDGHLVMVFFDPYSEEQRLVTQLWEKVHPFPGSGRDHTLQILLTGLRDAEAGLRGRLTTRRLPGVAVAADRDAVRDWFLLGHLNALPSLLADREVRAAVDDFAARHALADGRVLVPSGVHLIHFHAARSNIDHVPAALVPVSCDDS